MLFVRAPRGHGALQTKVTTNLETSNFSVVLTESWLLTQGSMEVLHHANPLHHKWTLKAPFQQCYSYLWANSQHPSLTLHSCRRSIAGQLLSRLFQSPSPRQRRWLRRQQHRCVIHQSIAWTLLPGAAGFT